MPFASRVACALAAATMLWVTPAAAQDDPVAQADARFQEGLALFEDGKHGEACIKFEESQVLDPKLNTLLNLALCHIEIGKTGSAFDELTEAKRMAAEAGSAKREAFATEQLEKLNAVLARVTITHQQEVLAPSVTIDGRPLDASKLGTALPIDPGAHTIVASVAGVAPWEKRVDIPAGPSSTEVTIPRLEVPRTAATPPGPAPAAPVLPRPEPTAPPPEEEGGGLSPLVWIGFGVGGAGLIAGAVTGGLALSSWGSISDQCVDDLCPAGSEDDLDRANLLANVSNATFAVGAVGIGVGLVGLFLPSDDDDGDAETGLTVRPLIGPGAIGVTGSF